MSTNRKTDEADEKGIRFDSISERKKRGGLHTPKLLTSRTRRQSVTSTKILL